MAMAILIPARLGSKGIAQKNLQLIGNMTLIEMSISQAINGYDPESVFVSSESETILEIARNWGVCVHKRDPVAATDEATADDVVRDFLSNPRIGLDDYIIYLQPTSPCRTHEHIVAAREIFLNSDKSALVSVRKTKDHPEKLLRINDNKKIENFLTDGNPVANRQSLQELYIANGSIYIFTVRSFLEKNTIPIINANPYFMSVEDSLDIDDTFDLQFAQYLKRDSNNGKLEI